MKRILPYLLTLFIFSLALTSIKPSYTFVNTHDEDDNLVSGYLMANRDYVLNRDIFSHHLPGAYLISEKIESIFLPNTTYESVFIHRTFVTFWNMLWAITLLYIFGPKFLWLIAMTELIRNSYLFGLFHAENLIVYPLIYLCLSLFTDHKHKPLLLGIVTGTVAVLLSPLWPLLVITTSHFIWVNRRDYKKLLVCFFSGITPVVYVFLKIDSREFFAQFFGYNALTYAPMVMKKPLLYTLAAFLAPAISMFDFSLSSKLITIQFLVLLVFVFDNKRLGLKKWLLFGIILGIVGLRRTPRFSNEGIDFHVLPWVIGLATLCWYKFFYRQTKITIIWLSFLFLPVLLLSWDIQAYMPTKESAGKMVIRYEDNSKIVNYFLNNKGDKETLFTLPAHTLLYRQTKIEPFNRYLFYLPWMEQSPILFSDLQKSFENKLPTYIFIDTINFPYTPPKFIIDVLNKYDKEIIDSEQPPVYVLKTK